MEDAEFITRYIAVWGWQLIALMFFTSALIFFTLERTIASQGFYIAFFLIFVGCEFMSIKRKREVLNEN